jgi:hypothetical protein
MSTQEERSHPAALVLSRKSVSRATLNYEQPLVEPQPSQT